MAGAAESFNIPLRAIIQYAKDATAALEAEGDTDAALRWELFTEFLEKDVASGKKQFRFQSVQLGL